jgi:hypothetical protein
VLSAAYQRSGAASREPLAADPENRWLTRFSPRRLEAEELRDAMLFVVGRLDASFDGPAGADLSAPRRSLYVQTARWDRSSYANLFDAANPDASVERRTISTVAPQALFLLNHEFVQAQARHFAGRLLREAPVGEAARIDWACREVFGRPAGAEEVRIAKQLLIKSGGADSAAAWTDLAHVLLCGNEFIYVE